MTQNVGVGLNLFAKTLVELNEVIALIYGTLRMLNACHVGSQLTRLVTNIINR